MSTLVVYANATTDGYIVSESGVDGSFDGSYDAAITGWSDVFVAMTGSAASSLFIGQLYWEGDFHWLWDVGQAFLSFDTSVVGTDTISDAVLTTTGHSGGYIEDARARLYDWGASLTSGDWVGYASLSGYTLLAHSGMSEWTSGATNNWTDDALAANVNKTGSTRMILHSASNQAHTETNMWGNLRGPYYSGTTSDPKLTITHTEADVVPVWSTPSNASGISSTPDLRFTIPSIAMPMHFNLQLDTANTFNTGDLRDLSTITSQTGWEYWNGTAWTAFPATGVPSSYVGNEVRYTVGTVLSNATWYRRVRVGV